MIPPEKRMSWNRFPTNFVCVRFFLVLFCFVLFFSLSPIPLFRNSASIVNGVETFTTSPTGITNLLVYI